MNEKDYKKQSQNQNFKFVKRYIIEIDFEILTIKKYIIEFQINYLFILK